MKKYYGKYLPLFVLLPAVSVVGCGSSGSDGVTSGSSRTVGVVKQVTPDSITVGSVTFDTTGASVSGDVSNDSVSQIDPGMVVVVDGSVDGSGQQGVADHIDYDAEVEGEVISNDCTGTLPCEMDVMGQTVQVTDTTMFKSEIPDVGSVDLILVGAYVEVSGYSDGNGTIVATYIKLEDDQIQMEEHYEMEVEGMVTNLDTTAGTFEIGGQLIHYDPADFNLTLENGMNVECHLEDNGMGNMTAVEIELEDDYGDDSSEGDEMEIEGMVTSDGVAADGTFAINGQTVKLADNVKYEGGLTQDDIMNGAIIEVEGYLDENGMLIVTEVGSEADDSSDDGSTDSSTDDGGSSGSSDSVTPPPV
ncbi:MAG: DUF5666 domain-containing protein [Gammaproteobacteria bacterium]|nr:DUF5666 domain-containing protein [Gammaproteobacteria bacterium]